MAVIPGTTGAACRINAGVGSGGQMADWVESVEVWEDGMRRRIQPKDLAYAYRYSTLLDSPRSIVTSVRLRFGPAEDPARIKERMSALTARRRRKFPRNPRNCGSVFRSTEDGTPAGLLIDRASEIALAAGSAKDYESIHRGLFEWVAGALKDHGCTLATQRIAELLEMDLDLDTQGLQVWRMKREEAEEA